jgi:hypothetical protein
LTDQLFFGRGGLDLVRLEDHDWILDVVLTDGDDILANSVRCAYLNGIATKLTLSRESFESLNRRSQALPCHSAILRKRNVLK